MDIAFYWGGNRTNYNHFVAALDANQDYLKSENIIYYPIQGHIYRPIFAANKAIQSGNDIELVKQDLFDRLSINHETKKLLLIDSKINGSPGRPFPKGISNTKVFNYFNSIKNLFSGHPFRVYVETRNPVTLVPRCYSENIASGDYRAYEDYVAETDISNFTWSSHIQRLQGKHNKIATTVWKYENYPYIWRDVVGAFSGVSNCQEFINPTEPELESLSFEGAQLFYKYTKEYANFPIEEIQKAKAVFLKQFSEKPTDVLSDHFPLDMIEFLTHKYDDDWYYIERMENTENIQPRESTNISHRLA